MDPILIVGAGITGALSAYFLSRGEYSAKPTIPVVIWDRESDVGGRMGTCRTTTCSVTADLGTPYFTANEPLWKPSNKALHESLYEELLKASIFRPVGETIIEDPSKESKATGKPQIGDLRRFVALKGAVTVVQYFLNQAKDVMVTTERHVSAISLSNDEEKWVVSTSDGHSAEFPAVILTMPIPLILELGGDMPSLIDNVIGLRRKLTAVKYSCRFAMALWYGPEVLTNVTWAATWVYDDDIIRFVGIDPKIRGLKSADGTSVIVHSSVPFGFAHADDDFESVKIKIMDRLVLRYPELKDKPPLDVKLIQWRYSQVHLPFVGEPGVVILCEKPLLALSGDAFVFASHFDGCVECGVKVSRAVRNFVTP